MDKIAQSILSEIFSTGDEPAAVAEKKGAVSDAWSPAVLLERADYLGRLAAAGEGAAGETLQQYKRHAMQLSVRCRDGVAEQHARHADLFIVVEGNAVLVTGGTIVGAQSVGPCEVRGSHVEGGQRRQLCAGDVAHVPAGMPHQMLVPGDRRFTALVLKIEETD